MPVKPKILLIGHLCHDVIPEGIKAGGAVAYAAVVAAQLDCEVHILTSFGPDYRFSHLFSFAEMEVVRATATTCFENIDTRHGRVQRLHSRAADLNPEALPKSWPAPDIVLLGPIANEVSISFLDCFQNSLVCACPQGWFRQWDATGRVFPKEISLNHWPEKADVISLSEEDLAGNDRMLSQLRQRAKRLLITHGKAGADLIIAGRSIRFPAKAAKVVDSTGAGDVFAASFVIRLWQCGNEHEAMEFALLAAAKSVEFADIRDMRIV